MLFFDGISCDPALNLAREEFLLTSLSVPCLSLWQNEPAVIVGRNQNTAAELDLEYAGANGIRAVRRITGGGAVYHDLGNVNYTFVTESGAKFSDFGHFARPVLQFLREAGADAELTGRNDITVCGRKVSGAAQCVRAGRLLHHGTLLFSCDLNRMTRVLRPNNAKFEGKASKSVGSRVANINGFLTEYTDCESFLNELKRFLIASFDAEPAELSPEQEAQIEELAQRRYRSYDWNFGASPAYNWSNSVRFPYGGVELRLEVNCGAIACAHIFGDFFGELDVSALCGALVGVRHERSALAACVDDLLPGRCITGMTRDDLLLLASP